MSADNWERPHMVEVFTTSTTLGWRYAGLLLTNRGAAGAVTLTLPAGQRGLRMRARKVTAQTFTLACAGSDTIVNSAGGSVTSLAVNKYLEIQFDGTAWLVMDELPGADDTIVAGQLADGAVDAAGVLADGVVTTAKILAANVTPAKMAGTLAGGGHFVGRNGAGACTLTGALVGDRVFVGWLSSESATDTTVGGENTLLTRAAFVALFETAITVADQIQQTSATDLSGNKYTVILLPAAA